jgi:hypothetical protein
VKSRRLHRFVVAWFAAAVIALWVSLVPAQSADRKFHTCTCLPMAASKVITFYDNHTIPANVGISSGMYTKVDGYRHINIVVEFEQAADDEKPVSLGVVFAYSSDGKQGARRYFNFEQNYSTPANPQMITLSGANSWHGSPHNRSSYMARFPVMGPYIQVFPFNHEGKDRKITIKAYLTT